MAERRHNLKSYQITYLRASISVPSISAAERAAVIGGAAASAGVGSLVIVAGRQLLAGATAVAALSCEAAGAQAEPGRLSHRSITNKM